jgi:hypothetical protein
LGLSQLIDGYANGWYVPAGVVAGTTVIHLVWAPQRVVWAAIGVSGAALLVSTMLAVWPSGATIRRRRPHRRRRSDPRSPVREGSRPGPASWASLVRITGSRPVGRRVAVAALGWALLAGAASRPLIGLIGGIAVAGGCWWSAGRPVLRAATVATLIAVGVYVIVEQQRYRYLPTIDWPADVSSANDLAWLAVTLLGAEVVVAVMRSRFGQRLGSSTSSNQ